MSLTRPKLDLAESVILEKINEGKGGDEDRLIAEIYIEAEDFFDELFEVITFREYDPRFTSFLFKRMALMNGAILTEGELMEFIKSLEDYMEDLRGVYYIAYRKAMQKYLSFRVPKSIITLFLIKHIALNFRDYLRTQFRLMNIISQEEIFAESEHPQEYLPSDSFKSITEGSGYYISLDGMCMLEKYIAYLLGIAGLSPEEIPAYSGYMPSGHWPALKRIRDKIRKQIQE